MGETSTWIALADRVSVFCFALMLFFSLTVDIIPVFSGAGPITEEKTANIPWPPRIMVDAFWFYAPYDPLLISNPTWLHAMAFPSFFYMCYYVAAIYAFSKKAEWIRTPSVVWGAMMSYSVLVIVLEEVWGPVTAPNLTVIFSAYCPLYIIFPFLMIFRAGGKGKMFPENLRSQKRKGE